MSSNDAVLPSEPRADLCAACVPESEASRRNPIVAASIGNMLEWYDFAAYGYFSVIIGRNFFPSDNRTTSLLSAFAVFAAAFFMRPLGGVLFGHVGDRFGRKIALVLSAGLMTISTFAIGLLPTYETAGLLAPALLVVLRLGQGLSVGGEYTSSAIFLAESAEPNRRGLMGSLACIGANCGVMAGSILGVILTSLLTPDEVREWGWRIPFLLGIVLGVMIFVLRRHMDEVHAPDDTVSPDERSPLRAAFALQGADILRGFAVTLVLAASFYIVFVYLVTYMHREDDLPTRTAFTINTISMAALTVIILVMGALSDRIGRKVLLALTAGGLALLSWPLFAMISTTQPALILTAQIGFAVLIGGYSAALPTALFEMFHHRSRCTALAISYNAAMALVGGTAPMAATWIVHHLQLPTGPGLYIAGLALISLTAVLTMRDAVGEALE